MSRTTIARGAALAAAALLTLTACGGADEAPAAERDAGSSEVAADEDEAEVAEEGAEDEAEVDAAADEEGAEETGAAAAAGEVSVVEIGAEFTDEETGDVITIVSAVRGNPTEFYLATDNPAGEMIYLEVAVTPGDVYGGVVSQQDFYLSAGGEEVDYAASADDEMIAAGYEYFDGPSRRDGEATGFIPIYLETTGDSLTGAYVRPEMKILGQDATVPEFRGEFEVPAA
jgi:hypothetical protein